MRLTFCDWETFTNVIFHFICFNFDERNMMLLWVMLRYWLIVRSMWSSHSRLWSPGCRWWCQWNRIHNRHGSLWNHSLSRCGSRHYAYCCTQCLWSGSWSIKWTKSLEVHGKINLEPHYGSPSLPCSSLIVSNYWSTF